MATPGKGARAGRTTLAVACVLTLATSSQGLLTTASKVDGRYLYNFGVVVLLAETLKLAISVYLLQKSRAQDPEGTVMTKEVRTAVLFVVPSVIYVLHNNIQFLFLKYVDPATYQILGNLKIVTTGLLFRVFLKRRLSKLKWIALVMLLVGATTSQIGGCDGHALSAPVAGYFFGILSAFMSAFAAVYSEYIMKRNNDSLYWQNAQLYFFGVIFNFLSLTVQDIRNGFHHGFWLFTMFHNFTGMTWLVVANLAGTGLLVSWVMKYADSIVKVYATSMAMLVTMVLSIYLFNLVATLQLFLGILGASISLILYYMRPEDLSVAEGPEPLGLPTTAPRKTST